MSHSRFPLFHIPDSRLGADTGQVIWTLNLGEIVSDRSEIVIELMKDQWESMVGMAGMFIVTIGIGIFIQPLYDVPEARAFGEEGTTKSDLFCSNY